LSDPAAATEVRVVGGELLIFDEVMGKGGAHSPPGEKEVRTTVTGIMNS
jgi:hypothetical protein